MARTGAERTAKWRERNGPVAISHETRARLKRLQRLLPVGDSLGAMIAFLSLAQPDDVRRIVDNARRRWCYCTPMEGERRELRHVDCLPEGWTIVERDPAEPTAAEYPDEKAHDVACQCCGCGEWLNRGV